EFFPLPRAFSMTEMPYLYWAFLYTSTGVNSYRCVMEAMASRKPLVVTNIRGSRDLVKHGVNGFVVDLENDQSLIESFVKLINDKKLREQMGQASLNEIQPYSLKNVLHEMRGIYSRFIEGNDLNFTEELK
ncbi:hypothetical protein CV945_15040, partial [Geobacillus sp. Manikaran-105]|uniref:glycosyltransferase n=1 Tax=Geobacillus sp. Manikaran-105 TaxID=2055940 RepID=UPI000CB2C98B